MKLPISICVAAIVATAVGAQSASHASVNPNARAYFSQLYEAGGFFSSINLTDSDGKPDVRRELNTDYVCFSDDFASVNFFTFNTMAYDERFATAFASVSKGPTTPEQWQESTRIMQLVRQDAPYVDFLDDTTLSVLPARAKTFLRQGGRLLTAEFYRKGVKSNEVEYQWNGSAWVIQESQDPSAYTKTTKVFHLSIEPTTLRYVEQVTITITVGSGETATTESRTVDSELGSGACERIPAAQSK